MDPPPPSTPRHLLSLPSRSSRHQLAPSSFSRTPPPTPATDLGAFGIQLVPRLFPVPG